MKTKKYFILAAAAIALAACNNDDNGDAPVAAEITAGVSGQATKAVNNVWEADEIGVTVADAPNSDMEEVYRNVKYTTDATTASAANFTSADPIWFMDSEEQVTFSAYGPSLQRL